MSEEEIIELREEKQRELMEDIAREKRLYRSHTEFFDKFMDLFGDSLIKMKEYCNRYDWDFDLTLDIARGEI